MTTATEEILLRAENVTKTFPGVTALKAISFELRAGEIHALCGENGAGKSTLIKVLSGIHAAGSYSGTILVREKLAQFAGVADAERAGLAVIYQELALVDELTVAENLFLGAPPTRMGLIDWNAMYSRTRELFARIKLDIDPARCISELGVGQKQLVEIAKALGKDSRILILDEPTAALTERETEVLLNILRELRSRGIGCIYISHKLDEVFSIADRITVLRDGESVGTLDTASTNKNEIIRRMVGREIADLFPRRSSTPGIVLLKVEGLSVADPAGRKQVLRDLSFDVRAGEVVGIGGLLGAGRTELLMHLFGAWGKRITGRVTIDGAPFDAPTPHAAIERGLVLVSEDRKRYGLVLEKEVGFNLSLSSLLKILTGGLIDSQREYAMNRRYFDSLRVRATGMDAIVGRLSGGNQQKIVFGKALMTEPKVVLLDEPTRGVDVGAKIEIYNLINELTAAGKAVVLVSSELPELLGMSDRIIMLREGRVGGVFARSEATQERLLSAAMGEGGAAHAE